MARPKHDWQWRRHVAEGRQRLHRQKMLIARLRFQGREEMSLRAQVFFGEMQKLLQDDFEAYLAELLACG